MIKKSSEPPPKGENFLYCFWIWTEKHLKTFEFKSNKNFICANDAIAFKLSSIHDS